VFAVGGNALFSVASTLGYLSIVSVLSSVSPVFLVVLAYVFLHERLSRAQQLGVASALVGVALIAAG
jgi:drug/metabolite transporter (DMT)-like permease